MANPTPAYSLEDIHQDAIKELNILRANGDLSSDDVLILQNTKRGEDVLDYANNLITSGGPGPKVNAKVMTSLEPLITRFERFEGVVDALVGVVPSPFGVDIAGLLLGTLKFVFKVTKDVISALESFLDTIERFSKVLPTFQVYVELYSSSDRQLMRKALTNIYVDVMLFAIRAVKLFARSKSGVLLSAIGKSLQDELQPLIDNIEQSRKDVDSAALTESFYELRKMRLEYRQDKSRREATGTIPLVAPSTVQPVIAKPFIEIPSGRLSNSFTGRKTELVQIANALNAGALEGSPRFVVHGMPGVGKSQIALRFAQDEFDAKSFSYILWINASSVEKLVQGFTLLLDRIGLRKGSSSDQGERVTAVKRWLESNDAVTKDRWLLVFDDVNRSTFEALCEMLPPTHPKGSILFTTRSKHVALALSNLRSQNMEILELQPPPDTDAATLFCRVAGLSDDENSHGLPSEAKELVNIVGRLPLAVDQAASFMKATQYSISDLRTLFKSNLLEFSRLLEGEWKNELSTESEKSVAATFVSVFKEVQRGPCETLHLLCVLSFLDPEGVQVKMLREGAAHSLTSTKPPAAKRPPTLSRRSSSFRFKYSIWGWPKRAGSEPPAGSQSASTADLEAEDSDIQHLLSTLQSPTLLQNAIQPLQNFALVKPEKLKDSPSFGMHGLVQYLVRSKLITDSQRSQWLKAAINIICGAFQQIENPSSPNAWNACEDFIPHIQALGEHCEKYSSENDEMLAAQVSVAKYFQSRGQYQEAETLYKLGFERYKQKQGETHSRTLNVADGLAATYALQNKFKDSEELFKWAYQVHKDKRGADHPDALDALENLANAISSQGGRETEAERLCKMALQGHEQRPEDDSRPTDILTAARSLGSIYVKQSRFEDAERMFRRVLEGFEKNLGPNDPETLSGAHDLAYNYYRQKQFKAAEPLFERALEGNEALLDKAHPETLRVARLLASVYLQNGRHEDAATLCQRALASAEMQLKKDHPERLRLLQSWKRIQRTREASKNRKDPQEAGAGEGEIETEAQGDKVHEVKAGDSEEI